MINFVTAIRYFLHRLEEGVENEIGDGNDPYCQRLKETVLPAIHGTKIVMSFSLIERLIVQVENLPQNNKFDGHQLKEKLINLGFEKKWYGWDELEGFLSLRHCFAHEFGKVTQRQQKIIEQLHRKLCEGLIRNEQGEAIEPYFDVYKGDIFLKPEATARLAKLFNVILNFLLKKGLLIEKSPYVDA